jgi:hypothetical protein
VLFNKTIDDFSFRWTLIYQPNDLITNAISFLLSLILIIIDLYIFPLIFAHDIIQLMTFHKVDTVIYQPRGSDVRRSQRLGVCWFEAATYKKE